MTQVAGPSYVQQGVALVTRAVEEDTARNYEEALELYDRSIECFFHAMKTEVQEEVQKSIIRSKCLEYLARSEQLQDYLKKR